MKLDRIAVETTNLTDEERMTLSDPLFVTPEEALRIVEERRAKRPVSMEDTQKTLAMLEITALRRA